MEEYKLKVSTNNLLTPKKKKDLILKVLEENPWGLMPEGISKLTKINANTVKSILPKLNGVQKKEGVRGFYEIVKKNPHGLFDWTFHNLRLFIQLEDYTGLEIKRKEISEGLIKIYFSISPNTKKANFEISSEFPFNISSLQLVFYFVKCFLVSECISNQEILEEDAVISSIEFNKDYSNLRLDGPSCVSLSSLGDQFKIYQKKYCVRYEHKITSPIGCVDLTELLVNQGNVLGISNRVSAVEKKLAKLEYNTSKFASIQPLLIKILERLDNLEEKNNRSLNI